MRMSGGSYLKASGVQTGAGKANTQHHNGTTYTSHHLATEDHIIEEDAEESSLPSVSE